MLQLGPVFAARLRYRQDFVHLMVPPVIQVNPTLVEQCGRAIEAAQRQLCKLEWDNASNAVRQRLVLNLATANACCLRADMHALLHDIWCQRLRPDAGANAAALSD